MTVFLGLLFPGSVASTPPGYASIPAHGMMIILEAPTAEEKVDTDRKRNERPELPELDQEFLRDQIEVRDQADDAYRYQDEGTEPATASVHAKPPESTSRGRGLA
jgi:hypothetical protein